MAEGEDAPCCRCWRPRLQARLRHLPCAQQPWTSPAQWRAACLRCGTCGVGECVGWMRVKLWRLPCAWQPWTSPLHSGVQPACNVGPVVRGIV